MELWRPTIRRVGGLADQLEPMGHVTPRRSGGDAHVDGASSALSPGDG
jgi:hypothetical protein